MKPWPETLKATLRNKFFYNPLTGEVKRRMARGFREAKLAKDVYGYYPACVTDEVTGQSWQLKLHRIVFFLATEKEPEFIDFADKNKDNLKLENLIPYRKTSSPKTYKSPLSELEEEPYTPPDFQALARELEKNPDAKGYVGKEAEDRLRDARFGLSPEDLPES